MAGVIDSFLFVAKCAQLYEAASNMKKAIDSPTTHNRTAIIVAESLFMASQVGEICTNSNSLFGIDLEVEKEDVRLWKSLQAEVSSISDEEWKQIQAKGAQSEKVIKDWDKLHDGAKICANTTDIVRRFTREELTCDDYIIIAVRLCDIANVVLGKYPHIIFENPKVYKEEISSTLDLLGVCGVAINNRQVILRRLNVAVVLEPPIEIDIEANPAPNPPARNARLNQENTEYITFLQEQLAPLEDLENLDTFPDYIEGLDARFTCPITKKKIRFVSTPNDPDGLTEVIVYYERKALEEVIRRGETPPNWPHQIPATEENISTSRIIQRQIDNTLVQGRELIRELLREAQRA